MYRTLNAASAEWTARPHQDNCSVHLRTVRLASERDVSTPRGEARSRCHRRTPRFSRGSCLILHRMASPVAELKPKLSAADYLWSPQPCPICDVPPTRRLGSRGGVAHREGKGVQCEVWRCGS